VEGEEVRKILNMTPKTKIIIAGKKNLADRISNNLKKQRGRKVN